MEDIVIGLYSLVFPVRCPLILQISLNHLALLPYSSPTRHLWIKRSSMMRGNCSYYSMKIKRGIHFCNIKTINLAIKPIKHYLALKGRKIERLIGSRA